jgi:hypothetical protein
MAEDMTANQDYQLVMKFLQLIQPGDMDEDSANQLMMIGQRIQNGGALSDKEREMFESVVGAMPANPTPPPATSMGQMTDADQRMAEEEAFQQMIMEQNQMGQTMQPMQPMMEDPRATSPRPMLRPNR